MNNHVKIKALLKSLLRKSLGDRNYEKVAQQVQRIRSVYKNTVRKAKYLKFRIKGRTLKRPVRILLTRYGGLGDILLSTPAIRALKKMYPRAFVGFDTSQIGKELLGGNPDIDQITVRSAYYIKNDFDWHWHLTYEHFPELHITEGYLKWMGIKNRIRRDEKNPILILSDSDKEFAEEFIESCGISNNELVIGLHAQAHYEQRRWPLENFNEVLDYMEERWSAKIIEFGADGEATVGRGINLIGKCSMKESAAVLQKCTLLVCNDSLMLHVAGALDVPVVGIFGPAPPTTRLPFNDVSFGCYTKDGCRGCILHQKDPSKFGMSCDKDFPECMHSVKPIEVIKATDRLMEKIRPKRDQTDKTNKLRPKVSVLMSVYNGEKYLREAIDSILNQNFKDFEFLIIDDGSTDSSAEIIRSYSDPRIRLIQNEKNIGLTRSLNKGLKLAQGQYIARMDGDDISFPERLEKQVRFLDENKNVAVISSSVILVDSCGKEAKRWIFATDSDEIKRVFLRDQNQIAHPFSMYRKKCVEKVGMYREEFKAAQDFDLWMRMIEQYDIANIREPLGRYRVGNNSVSATKWKLQKSNHHLGYICAIQRKIFGRDYLGYEPAGASFQALRHELARGLFSRRRILSKNYLLCAQKYSFKAAGQWDRLTAMKYFLKSLLANPFNLNVWIYGINRVIGKTQKLFWALNKRFEIH